MKFGIKNKRLIKYAVVLLAAVIVRILLAFIMPLEAQKYAGPIIIVLAIAAFFTWDYLDKGRNRNQAGNKNENPKS